ncbi:hypothetical protein BS50DRAFT_637497 [Corynespora cassiicola Philippines]|uniref:Uncharacterized protein n=1 Tax=Corynespora cassiicola Philippines TaxID=1448308 RepID=A0A2T2NBX7_CORCC|nr:hypothetical protein BS50DRAFT_637497 [Corynespora cassiicola Philippines]
MPETRGDRALCIERRNLAHFKPSAAAILLVLHHEYLLLNRQVAREALEVLFKNHKVLLSCGPYVLRSLLYLIEEQNGPSKQWLKWLKHIELDWITFPNLRFYPPNREAFPDVSSWEQDPHEVDVDYIRGAQYSGHYDENDYEGGSHYDDNFYAPENTILYPSFTQLEQDQAPDPNDPFGFATHYPFTDPSREPTDESEAQEDSATKLDLLISTEVTPLFGYLSSPTFSLSSITLPLYFISSNSFALRDADRPGYGLPVQLRYWAQMCVHALIMLLDSATLLSEVRVKYIPWDIWASMESGEELARLLEHGVLFDREVEGGVRAFEGQAFRSLWAGLQERGFCEGDDRMGLEATVEFVKWEGDLDRCRVGDELEVVFTNGVMFDADMAPQFYAIICFFDTDMELLLR